MPEHPGPPLTARELVRTHAYPVLAAVGTTALVVIAICLIPIARHAQHMNQCVSRQLPTWCIDVR